MTTDNQPRADRLAHPPMRRRQFRELRLAIELPHKANRITGRLEIHRDALAHVVDHADRADQQRIGNPNHLARLAHRELIVQ